MKGASWSAPAVPGSSSSLEEETHSSHILTLQMGKLRPRKRCELSEGTSGFPGGGKLRLPGEKNLPFRQGQTNNVIEIYI